MTIADDDDPRPQAAVENERQGVIPTEPPPTITRVGRSVDPPSRGGRDLQTHDDAMLGESVGIAERLLAPPDGKAVAAWRDSFDAWRRDAVALVGRAFSRAVAEEFRRAVSTPGRRQGADPWLVPEQQALRNGREMLLMLRHGDVGRKRNRSGP